MDNQDPIRKHIQAYLLSTLSDDEHAQVEARIEQDEAWQKVLEEETEVLALLDSLEAEEAPTGLAERTMGRIDAEEPIEAITPSRSWHWVLTSVFTILIFGGLYYSDSFQHQIATYKVSHGSNMKNLGLVFKMYANESDGGTYPPLTPYEDLWMFDVESIYPAYCSSLTILVSPRLPNYVSLIEEMEQLEQSPNKDWRRITEIAAEGYVYIGWNFKNEEELAMLIQERQMLAKADDEIETVSGEKLHRLREGIERFLITDINNPAGSANAQATVPIFFESLNAIQSRKSNEGSNVLYMDGHIELHAPNSHLLTIPSTLERFHLED